MKNFICEDCDPPKGFKKMVSLQKHQNIYHKNTIAKQVCPKCNKKFGSLNSLKSHIKWHKSIEILQRAQMLRKKREQALKNMASAARRTTSRMPHKSAPAKLLSMRK